MARSRRGWLQAGAACAGGYRHGWFAAGYHPRPLLKQEGSSRIPLLIQEGPGRERRGWLQARTSRPSTSSCAAAAASRPARG